MNTGNSLAPGDAGGEVPALIERLFETGQRLEELTGGEVDSVTDRDGRTFLLRRAQDQLRQSDAARQAAILNALPARISLLDTQGRIVSVNEAWRRFAGVDAMQGPRDGIGLSYFDICANASERGSPEARQIAGGVRSVLDGNVPSFSMEYPCHSQTEQRWFLLTVTPLAEDHPSGAVVMHLDITEQKRADETLQKQAEDLRERERQFRSLVEGAPDMVFVVTDLVFSYVNPASCRLFGANSPKSCWSIR